jgi:hypothetical protein
MSGRIETLDIFDFGMVSGLILNEMQKQRDKKPESIFRQQRAEFFLHFIFLESEWLSFTPYSSGI